MCRKKPTSAPQKSKLRNFFASKCPTIKKVCTMESLKDPKNSYVWRDAIQSLYTGGYSHDYLENTYDENGDFSRVPREKILRDILFSIKKKAEFFLETCVVLVQSFDKYEYVPFAKGQIESIRDKSKKKAEELPDIGDPDLSTVVDKDWIAHISDRREFRQKVIRILVSNLLHGPFSFNIGPGKTIIFDGHCLTREDIISLGIDHKEFTDQEISITPLVMTNQNNRIKYKLDKRFRNKVGEADYQLFFYHKKFMELSSKPFTFIGYSDDTDIMNYGFAYYEKMNLAKKNISEYKIINITKLLEKETTYYDLQVGYEYIVNFAKMSTKTKKFLGNSVPNAPVFSYLACVLSGGSDYTIGHYYVPHEHFFNVFWDGDLENIITFDKDDIIFNGSKYVDMISRAYCLAFMKKGKEVYKATDSKDPMVRQMIEKKANTPYSFPSVKDLTACAFQMYYYLLLVNQLGEPELNQMEQILDSFECRKLDSKNPWDKENFERNIYDENGGLIL